MRDGLLFEGYVFDKFKEDNEKELIGRKTPKTIDAIKKKAEFIKKLFGKGEPFRKLKYECDEYTITGEADFIGQVNFNGKKVKAIADLKFTGNLKIWEDKLSLMKREEFIQAFLYPYLYYQETSEILPFIYVCVENTFDKPLFKLIKLNPTLSDFGYIVDTVERVHNDSSYVPYAGYGTCVDGKWGRCNFLEHCEHGRNFLGETVEFDLSNLT